MDADETEIFAKPVKLKELVTYQSGAIVSRTLLEKNTGTVTLFAFDQGQALSEHTAPYDAMTIVIEGRVNIKIDGRDFLLDEGQMILMPANKPHALKAATRFKMILIMIRSNA
jgi:quercetin dioxygenase-like cupin family protein